MPELCLVTADGNPSLHSAMRGLRGCGSEMAAPPGQRVPGGTGRGERFGNARLGLLSALLLWGQTAQKGARPRSAQRVWLCGLENIVTGATGRLLTGRTAQSCLSPCEEQGQQKCKCL